MLAFLVDSVAEFLQPHLFTVVKRFFRIIVEARCRIQWPIWRVEVVQRIRPVILKCPRIVPAQDFNSLQELTVGKQGFSVADCRTFLVPERYVEFPLPVNSVQSVKACLVEEYEQCGRFYRRYPRALAIVFITPLQIVLFLSLSLSSES